MIRFSLRLRFTVVTALTVAAAGAALLTGGYLLAAHSMRASAPVVASGVVSPSGDAAPVGSDSRLSYDGQAMTGSDFKTATADLQASMQRAYDERTEQTLHSFLQYGAIAWTVAVLLAGAASWLLAGRLLRPLRTIIGMAQAVAASPTQLGRRLRVDRWTVEVRALTAAFNVMLDRLDGVFHGQRRFVANAAHELRTPLAVNRALIEVALDGSSVPTETAELAGSLLTVNDRNERLIEALLTLASSEQELTERTTVDLADIAAFALDEVRPLAEKAGVRTELRPGPAVVAGEVVLLERLAVNVIGNAIRYNVPAGSVVVATSAAAGESVLTVTNTGPIVPESDVDSLFEPFRRLDSSESEPGFGLGLSIVRAIAWAHGGETTLRPAPGGGLTVTVRLPGSTT